jgi:hypothetical protein
LVKSNLYDGDPLDDPLLPSPNQLKYRILIKNKKIQKLINANPPQQQQFSNQQTSTQAQQSLLNNHQNASKTQLSQQISNGSMWPSSSKAHNLSIDNTILINIANGLDQGSIDGLNGNELEKNETTIDRTDNDNTQLGAKEQNLKRNVASFVHKSKSLTDSAFNKINGILSSNNLNKNSKKLKNAKGSKNETSMNQMTLNTNNLLPHESSNLLSNNHSNPESMSASVAAISTCDTELPMNKIEADSSSYLNFIRKR